MVDNTMETRGANSFILPWINIIKEAKANIPKNIDDSQKYCFCEQEAIKISINNLHKFPWVEDKFTRKKIDIHGWYFNMHNGLLYILNQETQVFEPYYS